MVLVDVRLRVGVDSLRQQRPGRRAADLFEARSETVKVTPVSELAELCDVSLAFDANETAVAGKLVGEDDDGGEPPGYTTDFVHNDSWPTRCLLKCQPAVSIKKTTRMGAKIDEYEKDKGPGLYPYCAFIGDSLRASVVCEDAEAFWKTYQALVGDPDEGVHPSAHAGNEGGGPSQTAVLNARLLESLKASLDAAEGRGHGCAMFGA